MKKIIIALIGILISKNLAVAQNIVLQESFNNGSLPTGWTIDSAGVTPVNAWKFSGTPSGFTGAGFDNKHPRIRYFNPQDEIDCNLTTVNISTSTLSSVYLGFGEVFGTDNTGRTVQYVDVSNNNGATWNNVIENIYYRGGVSFTAVRTVVDISSFAVGFSNIKVRFRFKDSNGGNGGWAIDSVVIADSIPCTLPVDTGVTVSSTGKFACPGQPLQLSIAALSRGAGQTYQWQSKPNAAAVYSNITGAVYDTLSTAQNQQTYYRCQITCQSQMAYSSELMLKDVPDPYTTTYSGIEICPGKFDTLYFTNMPASHAPFVYQWQSANYPSGTTFTNIALNSTDSIYAVDGSLYSVATDFRCQVGCASGTATTTSTVTSVGLNPNTLCYCYPYHGANCANGPSINYVEILSTSLNKDLFCVQQPYPHPSSYQFIDPSTPNGTTNLIRNAMYTLALGLRDTQPPPIAFAPYMWIDYNRNGLFEVTEEDSLGLYIANDTAYYNFYVPANATPGLTGMRIRAFYLTVPQNPLNFGCQATFGGTAVDFLITIDSTVGIGELGMGNGELRLWPNPARDEVAVSSNDFIRDLKILSASGQEVYSLNDLPAQKHTVSTKHLQNGVYYVVVATDKGRVVRKLVVLK